MSIKLTKHEKEQMIEMIKDFYYMEKAEEIGDLAAGSFLEFISKELGPYYYNQGIRDARQMVEQKIIGMEEDILSLERPLMRKR